MKSQDPTLDGFEGVATAGEKDPRIVTPADERGVRLKVSRELGTCARCGTEGTQTVTAYDPKVYEGEVCGPCILAGKANDLEVESPRMRPMVFVAKALRGDEPFRSLLRAADEQRRNPKKAETIAEVAKARAEGDRLLRRLGLVRSRPPANRRERRIEARRNRRAKSKTRKVRKVAKVETEQLEDFDSFAESFK